MKTNFALIILIAVIQIVSCKKEENPKINMDKSEITLQHNTTEQLKSNQVGTWSSNDTNVAKVSQTGLVTGVRIGNAKIFVKANGVTAECIVWVTAKSNLYKEPYYVFGQSVSYVKMKESRSVMSETSTGLIFKGENSKVRYVMYVFSNNTMTSADVMLSNTTGIVDEAVTFLEERYIFKGYVSEVAFYKDGKGNIAALNVNATLGLNVIYYRESGKKSTSIDFDEYKKVLSKFQSLK